MISIPKENHRHRRLTFVGKIDFLQTSVFSMSKHMRLLNTFPVLASIFCLVSCEDNQTSLFIRQVQANEAPQCTVSSDVSSKALAQGVLDVGLQKVYFAMLLVGGQLKDVGNNDLNRTEANRISIDTAEVTVKSTGGEVLSKYSVPVNGFVDPAAGSTFSTGVVGARILDFAASDFAASANITETLAEKGGFYTVVSRVQLFGQTLGGTRVTSNFFDFPVQVCYGCLVAYAPGTVSSDVSGLNCAAASDAPISGGACNVGQDAAVDCRNCSAVNPALCRLTK